MPDSSDTTFDHSIPVLQEVIVPGSQSHARGAAVASPPAFDEPGDEPGEGVEVHAVTSAQVQAFETPEPSAPFELPQSPEPFEPSSAFHFARTAAAPIQSLDADLLAERLRGRVASYMTGEGRAAVEARCRDALQDHSAWLVNQITREVVLTLETEMTGWVREAVEEELGRRAKES